MPYKLNPVTGELDFVTDISQKADLVDGKVPSSQLPSYVDDVLEFANFSSFPATGESGKIYVDLSTNDTYRWSGSSYVMIGSLDLEQVDAYLNKEGTTTIYVDGSIENVPYIGEGTKTNPFSTIQEALDYISSLSDTLSRLYIVEIASGTYPENVDFNIVSGSLYYIYLVGKGQVVLSPSSGAAIYSTTYAHNNRYINFENIKFYAPVTIQPSTVQGNILATTLYDITFKNCNFLSGVQNSTVSITAAQTINFINCNFESSNSVVSITNSKNVNIINTIQTSLDYITTNTNLYVYAYGFGVTYFSARNSLLASLTENTVTQNTIAILYNSTITGNVYVTGNINVINSFIAGSLTGTGNLYLYGGFVSLNSLTNVITINHASQIRSGTKIRAKIAADTTIASTPVLLPFATEDWDLKNEFTNTAGNYKFTVSEAGYYNIKVKLTVHTFNFNYSTYLKCSVYKNGNLSDSVFNYVCPATLATNLTSGNPLIIEGTVLMNLAVNDYIQLYAVSNSSGTVATSIANPSLVEINRVV